MNSKWDEAQDWERHWWDNCINTYGEEEKQLLYANRMGLQTFHNKKSPYNFDLGGISVLDIGGGPSSLLLKCVNMLGTVVEPLELPTWVLLRYDTAGIKFHRIAGENLDMTGYDEAWIYNVLQHTRDPQQIVENARHAAKLIRIFEWIDMPTNEGHLHTLTESNLNDWLGGEGKVEQLAGQANCYGLCYYGIFPT